SITFGLISIPVKLFSAVQEKSIKFNMLHDEEACPEGGGRIKLKRTCSACDQEVAWDDIVKGYEYSSGHYVTFTPDELSALDVDSIKAIDVVSFVPLTDIDPIYFNKTYYVAPDASGIKAYKLLADALEAEGQVGIAKVALREKEHLATIRLKDDLFVLETMHWPDEIREPDFEELEKKVDVRDTEVKMARQLIQQLSADFDPSEFQDDYRVQLEEMAAKKIEGEEVTVTAEAEEEPTKVVDLMEALKASVADVKKKKGDSSSGASKKKTTKRRASAS
ncbi:MAG: Ku protein, partial [Actinomycetota bacterium]